MHALQITPTIAAPIGWRQMIPALLAGLAIEELTDPGTVPDGLFGQAIVWLPSGQPEHLSPGPRDRDRRAMALPAECRLSAVSKRAVGCGRVCNSDRKTGRPRRPRALDADGIVQVTARDLRTSATTAGGRARAGNPRTSRGPETAS